MVGDVGVSGYFLLLIQISFFFLGGGGGRGWRGEVVGGGWGARVSVCFLQIIQI